MSSFGGTETVTLPLAASLFRPVMSHYLRGFSDFTEYATVGYMAKRIQMRKNRFQKIAESMKAARENPGPPGVPGDHGDHAPKQTVSNIGQPVTSLLSFIPIRTFPSSST